MWGVLQEQALHQRESISGAMVGRHYLAFAHVVCSVLCCLLMAFTFDYSLQVFLVFMHEDKKWLCM